jgi:hypothetical protein
MQRHVSLLMIKPVHEYEEKQFEVRIHSADMIQPYFVLKNFLVCAFQVGCDVQFRVIGELNV